MSPWILWPLAALAWPAAIYIAPRVRRWCYRQTLRLFGLTPEGVAEREGEAK